jgi:xylan 1,4-beta-xylosidase
MGVRNQLATINTAFRMVASRSETKDLPVVIGESDPDGCAACASANGLYPEYGYRNGALFAVYTIEQLTRTLDLAERHNVNILGAVTWAFEFEDQPIFGGFRALATCGVELPVLNTFRMLNKMGPQRLAVKSSGDLGLDTILGITGAPATGPAARNRGGVRGDKPDVSALASRDERRITVICWNYHDDDVPGPTADIDLQLSGLPADVQTAKLTEWRIDDVHSNAYTAWKKLGSPETPSAEQLSEMETAAKLAQVAGPADTAITGGAAHVTLHLPRQAVSLVELAW